MPEAGILTNACDNAVAKETTMKYRIFTDPGHGWIRVPIAELHDLGIAQQVTPWSYMKGEWAYLEEDVDMGLFFEAYEDKHGRKPEFSETSSNSYSAIRGYEPYKPGSRPPRFSKKRIIEHRPGYDCVYYAIMKDGECVDEVGPYKWNKRSSLYYSDQDRKDALAAAKYEAKLRVLSLKETSN